MYNPDGSTKKVVQPGKAFFKPSDMVELKDGQFAVRDNNGIQIFSDEGKFCANSINYLLTHGALWLFYRNKCRQFSNKTLPLIRSQ